MLHGTATEMVESETESVDTTSTSLFAANGSRQGLTITNTHASQSLYVRFGSSAATAAKGIKIAAGATLSYPLVAGGWVPASAIQVIGSGSSTTLYAAEATGTKLTTT